MECECLICCETNGKLLYKVCNCNSYIHVECFEKMINMVSSHNTHCAVCKEKYSIKKTCTGCVFLNSELSYIVAAYDVLIIPILVFPFYGIYLFNDEKYANYILVVSLLMTFVCVCLVVWILLRYMYYTRKKIFCYMKPVWKRSALTFKDKNPKIVYYI